MRPLDLWHFRRSGPRRACPLLAPVAPDPIDHPDLRRMCPRDLADMPLPRLPAVTPPCRTTSQRSLP